MIYPKHFNHKELEHNLKCIHLRLNDYSLRRSWYKIKKAEYSDRAPKKRVILQFWYETNATPLNHEYFYEEFKNICENLCTPQFDNIGALLSDLYERFSKYAFKVQFRDCVKYCDGSLKLYKLGIRGKIAYKTKDGGFIDLYKRDIINAPEQYFEPYGEALSETGIIIPVRKHMLQGELNDNPIQTK
ncbi:hypothetical protein RY668_000217 [Shigella flexneri]|nr:hypothetical protein [Shigella flexneri]